MHVHFASDGCGVTGDHGDKYRYKYECVPDYTTGVTTSKETTCTEGDSEALENIDRHVLDCGSDLLTGFGLQACSGSSLVKYQYTCSAPSFVAASTLEIRTPCSQVQGQNIKNLDRHALECDAGGVLSGYQLYMGTNGDCNVNTDGTFVAQCVFAP